MTSAHLSCCITSFYGVTLLQVRFGVDLTDGRKYSVLLTVVNGGEIVLTVDNVQIGAVRSAGQRALQDCGGGRGGGDENECVLYVGQRSDDAAAGGAYRLHGILYNAVAYPGFTLQHYPF
jgi:hypothetical protein